jgi:ABC-type glycerol-3-phosphate transport system substrate-binding protein
MVDAITADANGIWHVVDEEPVTTADFFGEFADRLKSDDPGRIPAWLAKFFVGEDMVRFLTNSFSTANDQFKTEVGWEPEYPTYREGLQATVETWLDDGTLVIESNGYDWGDNVSSQYACRNCGRHFAANTRACPHCNSANQHPVTTS